MGDKEHKRQGSEYKRVKDSWRKPKGGDSKMRKEKSGKPPLVKVGRRKPKSQRGVHPSGYEEVLVENPEDLEDVDPEKEAVRIGSSVGGRKRGHILERADDLEIKVLNPGRRRELGSEDAEETSS